MPSPESSIGSANTDLCQLVAAAADLCRKPLRHAVVGAVHGDSLDLCLRLEARTPEGERVPAEDLELEIYRSGEDLNLTLAWRQGEDHPCCGRAAIRSGWMGPRGCAAAAHPRGPLEALARRLRALLRPDQG